MSTFLQSLKSSKPTIIPVHPAPFGPVGTGRTNMWIKWRSQQVGQVLIFGQRGNKPGCFTVVNISMSYDKTARYDVAFHEDTTPKEVARRLKDGEVIGDVNTIYTTVPGTYKYLELGLVDLLIARDTLLDTLHAAPVAV